MNSRALYSDMKKLLLINPPQTYYEESQGFSVYFPLSLLYPAAIVRDLCRVEIFDCLVRDFTIARHGDVSVFGTPFDRIREYVRQAKPDLIGITVPFTAQFENARMVSTICREVFPEVPVIMGGPDPSVRYRQILEEGHCDYCVVGEGEDTLREVITRFNSGEPLDRIPGLACRREGEIRFEPRRAIMDLDRLPLPAYDLIDVNEYLESRYLYRNRSFIHHHSMSIITSRGCPYNCVFCSIRLHMGRAYRHHSAEYVLNHLKLCIERFGIRSFHFEDDNLSMNRKRFEAILDSIIGSGLNIRWDTPNGIRADTLDYDILKKVKRSGCRQLTLAFESGSQRVLDEVIRKKTSLEYMIKVAGMCHDLKLLANAFYVIGFPGETIREMEETTGLALRLLRECDLLPNVFVATPLYGTELYETCLSHEYIEGNPSPEELAKSTQIFGKPLIATEDFSRDDVLRVIDNYRRELKRELLRFSLKHPLYAARRLKDKAAVVKKLFLGKK
jgi:magnesium-protoporphyrin IX monomethyl ester (oxidative) cyclase